MEYNHAKAKDMVRSQEWPTNFYSFAAIIEQLDAATKEIEMLRNTIKCEHEWILKPCPRCGGYDEINCKVEKRCVKCGVLWPRIEMPI